MKILTINTRYIGGGGAAYIANTLHKEINKIEGYSSTFLYGRGIEGDENSKRIIYPKMDYLSALSYRLLAKEMNFNKNIEEEIKKCDIVHLHNIHGYYINYVKLFKLLKKYNKKIVWTLHDMWPITGRCSHSLECDGWKRNCGECKNRNIYPTSIIDRSHKELEIKRKVIGAICKKNMTIVTPSKWLANMCKDSYLNKFKIIDIPNGIEHKEIKVPKEDLRTKYSLSKKDKIILFVAADTKDKNKGIEYVLDVASRCREYKFISIGKKIENTKLDNFIQMGYISDRHKIDEIYSMSDIFIIPSLADNFPTTILESFANSTPAIGFNIGGIPEQIDGLTGKIVNSISSHELQKNIIDLLENEEMLNKHSIEARNKFLKEYTLKLCVDKYIDEYTKLGDNK